jgi:hypothetical protein
MQWSINPILHESASAAALREGVQQALIAGDAHYALATANPFRRIFQRPVAATAFNTLLGLFYIFYEGCFGFHALSFLLRYLDELTLSIINIHAIHFHILEN